MQLLGIHLRKPTSGECTAAAVLATGCWLLLTGLARATGYSLDAAEAGALLLVVAWGAIGARLGLGIDRGGRHLAVNIGVCAMLLASYETLLTLA